VKTNKNPGTKTDRRAFFSNAFMGTGLVISHLFAGGLAIRYLYPTNRKRTQRLFVGLRSDIPPGKSISYKSPTGQTINVIHGTAGFMALSDVCPHLGCKVHWESTSSEFICPCHDGHFDIQGAPTAGPPADMGVGLTRYTVVEDGDMVFIETQVDA
jgi:cytochrome b6-f complex iron-sulfur subunit